MLVCCCPLCQLANARITLRVKVPVCIPIVANFRNLNNLVLVQWHIPYTWDLQWCSTHLNCCSGDRSYAINPLKINECGRGHTFAIEKNVEGPTFTFNFIYIHAQKKIGSGHASKDTHSAAYTSIHLCMYIRMHMHTCTRALGSGKFNASETWLSAEI